MLKVVVAIALLLAVTLCKKIPGIGGKINIALLLTGAVTMLLGGFFNPADWVYAFVDGLNRMGWIMALSIAGALFAEISVRIGTMDTIIGAMTAKFSHRPRILVFCILFALLISGSLLGDAIAASTVIGMLTIGILVSMNLSFEKIAAIIVMGAATGSIMPPMTQALALSSTLVNTDPDPVITIGYVTVGCVFVVVAIYSMLFLVKKENVAGANGMVQIKHMDKAAGEILKQNWKSLIPVCFLILVVLLRTVNIPGLSVDLGPTILKSITFLTVGGEVVSLYDWLAGITILNGLTNGIVLSIFCAIAITFFFKEVRQNAGVIFKEGLSKVSTTLILQVCCSFMLGSFYYAGSIDAVSQFTQNLDPNVLKIGGAAAMLLMGMLTGSQSTTQNVVFSFFGPSLLAAGLNPVFAAVAGAHLAAGGQGMPPADLTTFVVCGMIGSMYSRKVDPVKAMLYCMPMCISLTIVGMVFLYI